MVFMVQTGFTTLIIDFMVLIIVFTVEEPPVEMPPIGEVMFITQEETQLSQEETPLPEEV